MGLDSSILLLQQSPYYHIYIQSGVTKISKVLLEVKICNGKMSKPDVNGLRRRRNCLPADQKVIMVKNNVIKKIIELKMLLVIYY